MNRIDYAMEMLHTKNVEFIQDYLHKFYSLNVTDFEFDDDAVPVLDSQEHFFYAGNYHDKEV